jgi:hypothetical protein
MILYFSINMQYTSIFFLLSPVNSCTYFKNHNKQSVEINAEFFLFEKSV